MSNEISVRMKNTIDYILSNDKVTLQTLSTNLNVSVRQIRYDFKKINALVFKNTKIPLLETNNKGLVIIDDYNLLMSFSKGTDLAFYNKKKDRLRLLNVIIAFNLPKLNLNQLAEQLNISRMTIKNDLDCVKESLGSYNLILKYQNKFILEGTPEDMFRYRIETILSLEYLLYRPKVNVMRDLMDEYFQENFVGIEVRELFYLLIDFIEREQLEVKDSHFYWLVSHILIYMWYDYNKIDAPIQNNDLSEKVSIDFSKLFFEIEEVYTIALTNDIQNQIKHIILAISKSKKKDIEQVNKIVLIFIFNLINYIEENYHQSFYKDKFLLRALYNYLESCVRKQGADIDICETIENQINIDKKLDKLIDLFCKENIHILNLNNIKDVAFIKIHFANSIDHYHPIRKKAILVSGISAYAKEHLKISLETSFELEIIDVISRFYIPVYEKWKKADVILFTEAIPEEFRKDLHALKIHSVLNEEDLKVLNQSRIFPKKNITNIYDIYEYHRKISKVYSLGVQNMGPWIEESEIYKLAHFAYNGMPFIIEKEDIETDDVVYINDVAKISFQITQERNVSVYINKDRNYIHLMLNTYEIDGIFYNLFKFYYLFKNEKNLIKLLNKADTEIIEYLKLGN